MARFVIRRSFWHLARDLVVLIGEHQDGEVQPGDTVHLPGLGDAVVASVELAQMQQGPEPCLVFPASILEKEPLFEPSTLDGTTIEAIPRWS